MTKLTRAGRSPEKVLSLIDELEQDPKSAGELAAAQISSRVHQILRMAFEASSLTQRDLAEILGVGESRVSQVLNGDGNVRVTALARYLRALGFVPEISAVPVNNEGRSIVLERRHRLQEPSTPAHVYMDLLEDTPGSERYVSVVIQGGKSRNMEASVIASKRVGQLPDVDLLARSILAKDPEWTVIGSYGNQSK